MVQLMAYGKQGARSIYRLSFAVTRFHRFSQSLEYSDGFFHGDLWIKLAVPILIPFHPCRE